MCRAMVIGVVTVSCPAIRPMTISPPSTFRQITWLPISSFSFSLLSAPLISTPSRSLNASVSPAAAIFT